MKVALVTPPPSVRSGIGDYTRDLLPHLREHCDVEVFVQHGADDPGWKGERARLASTLDPRRFDQVLYQLGNEQAHAFMPPMIRSIGGTVMQHDWVLFDLAMAAWPGLTRGGAKGHALALREGGLAQTQVYLRNWLDRRRQRAQPVPAMAREGLPGSLLFGWYGAEKSARWTADCAGLRIPGEGVERVRLELHVDPGRSVLVREGAHILAAGAASEVLEVRPHQRVRPELLLETTGIRVSAEQRRHGDSRRLGCAVRRVTWQDERGEHELDLAQPSTVPLAPITLSRDRFQLALNRSVVRFADAFIVHSRYVAELVRAERNAHTALGILHHGSMDRWREGDRGVARAELGLPDDWVRSCLVVSFGGVQAHKRIDKVLQGLALARRERPDIRLVLAGSTHSGDLDAKAMVEQLGLADAVRCTGYLSEVEAWDWLHAADFAVNLRGPTTGGTS